MSPLNSACVGAWSPAIQKTEQNGVTESWTSTHLPVALSSNPRVTNLGHLDGVPYPDSSPSVVPETQQRAHHGGRASPCHLGIRRVRTPYHAGVVDRAAEDEVGIHHGNSTFLPENIPKDTIKLVHPRGGRGRGNCLYAELPARALRGITCRFSTLHLFLLAPACLFSRRVMQNWQGQAVAKPVYRITRLQNARSLHVPPNDHRVCHTPLPPKWMKVEGSHVYQYILTRWSKTVMMRFILFDM